MAVLFWIFLDQICPNLIKLDQNGFSPIKRCYYKKLSHLQNGSKWLFDFWFFWIWSVKNGSNLIKLFVQKYLCQIWSGFLATKGFFQMNLPYFSKSWKVWLKAFRLVFIVINKWRADVYCSVGPIVFRPNFFSAQFFFGPNFSMQFFYTF